MEREFMNFNEAKKGDIMFIPNYEGSLGQIAMFDCVKNNLIYWLCQFDIGENQFTVSDGKTHLGFADEEREKYMYRKATNSEECLLLSMMEKFGYYFDEDENQLKADNVPEVGKPEITWDDTDNHVMEIKGLNGQQHYVIEQLLESWE